MRVGGQRHVWTALLIQEEAEWAPEPVCTFRREKKLLPLNGIRTLDRQTCSLVKI